MSLSKEHQLSDLVWLDVEQGSEEWRVARRGIPTGTGFKNIVNAKGERAGETRTTYLSQLIAESYGAEPATFKSKDMERGNELEPDARRLYEFTTDNDVVEVGGVYLDENRKVMISPDGLSPAKRIVQEIKCPLMKTHIKYILQSGVSPDSTDTVHKNKPLPGEYFLQCNGALMTTGYDKLHFISYCPEFTPMPMLIIEHCRDDSLISKMKEEITAFSNTLEAFKKRRMK